MFGLILDALLGIWNVILSLFDAFVGMITTLGYLLRYLANVTLWMPEYWALMPRLWTMLFPSLLGVVIVYKFLNRA